jgi:hypothetical protein
MLFIVPFTVWIAAATVLVALGVEEHWRMRRNK